MQECIDRGGKFLIPAQFHGAQPFRNGIAVVLVRNKDFRISERECIDKKGSVVAYHPWDLNLK
jgi:WG repeat protein